MDATGALSTRPPELSPEAVMALVRRHYGIDGSVRSLAGERDQNCLVETAGGSRYVFKISNPSEPAAVVDFQIAALDHIARAAPELPVPRVVRTLEGLYTRHDRAGRRLAHPRADADLS